MRTSLKSLLALALLSILALPAFAQERIDLWPNLAPGEMERSDDIDPQGGQPARVTTPRLLIYTPAEKKTDACVLVIPGGGYNVCYYQGETITNAQWWIEHGVTAAVLIYRVPRPNNAPIYQPARQDAQRAVRILRANAERLGINPNKIGAQGYSAGGHLTLITATASQTPAYDPIDEIDQQSAAVNFAIPVYAAYTLDDGADGPNANGGFGAQLLMDDLKFDEATPPLCLIHGDADIYSPLGSVEIYRKLHEMKIPCELHIYQGCVHGFMNWNDNVNAQSWRDQCLAWLVSIGMF